MRPRAHRPGRFSSSLLRGALAFFSAAMLLSPLAVQAQADNIEVWRNSLYDRYNRQEITFDQMLQEARTLDAVRRQPFLTKLGVLPASTQRKPGEQNLAVRTGSDPTRADGRGIFSDEDVECATKACIDRFRQAASLMDYPTRETSFHLFIKPLDLKVWKPASLADPAMDNLSRFHDFAQAMALDSEFALGARQGDGITRSSLETVLENLTKGHLGYAYPPKAWGKGYHPYEELIQVSKNTVRTMEATGLCTQYPSDCQRLQELRRMRKSPAELGLFQPGVSEAELYSVLEAQQEQDLAWMTEAFSSAQEQMAKDIADLNRKLCAASEAGEIPAPLQQQSQEAQRALYRIAVRYDVLFHQYPELMRRISGMASPFPFACQSIHQINMLRLAETSPTACVLQPSTTSKGGEENASNPPNAPKPGQ